MIILKSLYYWRKLLKLFFADYKNFAKYRYSNMSDKVISGGKFIALLEGSCSQTHVS